MSGRADLKSLEKNKNKNKNKKYNEQNQTSGG
jgi:hypothetical protein